MFETVIYNQFKMFGGDTWNLELTWTDDLENVKDLTDHNARLTMFASKTASRNSPIVLITQGPGGATGPGTIVLRATAPNIICTIEDEQSDFDSTPPGWLILEVDDPVGDWQRLIEGKLTYFPSS